MCVFQLLSHLASGAVHIIWIDWNEFVPQRFICTVVVVSFFVAVYVIFHIERLDPCLISFNVYFFVDLMFFFITAKRKVRFV